MSALAPAVVLALAVQRGAPIAPRQMLAEAQVESGLDPLAIHDDVTGRVYHPTGLAQALRIATHCEMDGHDIDVGLMQINSGNFPWLHLSLAEAFDPAQSIRAGALLLTAVSKYNTGSATRGFTNGYVRRVIAQEGAASSDGGTGPSRTGPPSHPRLAADLHNDLVNALIQPRPSQPQNPSVPRRASSAANPGRQAATPRSIAGGSGLIDPLIHPRPAQPSAPPSPPAPISRESTAEASNG